MLTTFVTFNRARNPSQNAPDDDVYDDDGDDVSDNYDDDNDDSFVNDDDNDDQK